jgi:hypothetical protein
MINNPPKNMLKIGLTVLTGHKSCKKASFLSDNLTKVYFHASSKQLKEIKNNANKNKKSDS